VSRLASVAGNRSMQGLAGLSRSSAARAAATDDQAGRRCRRRPGQGSQPRSGSGATDSRSYLGEWRRRVVTAERLYGSPPSYFPGSRATTAVESAEVLPIAMQSPTATSASGVARNARCRATRGRNRRGCIAQGCVPAWSTAATGSGFLVHFTKPLLHGSTSGAMKNRTHGLLNLNNRCFHAAECFIGSGSSVGVPIAVARERRDRGPSAVVAFQPGRNGRTARAESSAAAVSISVWNTTAR
jgi:hypothetical protein